MTATELNRLSGINEVLIKDGIVRVANGMDK